jgi:hypothetical protein
MDWMTQKAHKTQLGQILIDKKLISQDQLDAAIRAQAGSGRRLGEILADMKLITQAQVRGAIRRQRNLRMAAALAASLLGPLHAYAAVTAAPAAAVTRTLGERSLRELSDEELGQIAAQGRDDDALRDQARQAELRLQALVDQASRAGQGGAAAAAQHLLQDNKGVKVLGEIAQVFNPLAMLLSADTMMSGVSYDPGNAQAALGKDGSVTLRLPSTIGEISFHNIRVGKAPGPAFGNIDIHDIDLRGTTITVKPH